MLRAADHLRTSLILVLTVAEAGAAQQDLRTRLHPITEKLRHAGTFHVATGTWTRNARLSNLTGPDVVYNNTCSLVYYSSQESGERYQHRSRVPTDVGHGAPTTPSVYHGPTRYDEAPGCDTSYLVDAFQILYCSYRPLGLGTFSYAFEFANDFAFCAQADMAPDVSFVVSGLPGGTLTGSQSCWIVDVDLGGSGQAFLLAADQDGTYVGPSSSEQFGFSLGPVTAGITLADRTGPVVAGNFTWTGGMLSGPLTPCAGTDGTIWDNVVDLSEEGTGMASSDFFRATGSTSLPQGPGCYSFGGTPHADFYLKLYSDADCPPPSFIQNCRPGVDAGVIDCPCNNPPAFGGLGCNNFGVGPGISGTLDATGNPSLSNDTIVLSAWGSNDTSLTVFWAGSGTLHPTGLAHGAGVRCVTTTLTRLYVGSASAGAISRPALGDPSVSARSAALGIPITPGQTRHYFDVYRDPLAAGPCGNSASTVNLTNSISLTWGS